MSDHDQDPRRSPQKSPLSMWKVWLGVFVFIAYIVGVQIEAHSPQAEARRQQGAQNVINAMRSETYSECTGNERECRAQAEAAADLARKKVQIIGGK